MELKMKKNDKENYITKKEVEKILEKELGEINKKISDLKEQIDRIYEYVDEIFILQRKGQSPNEEEMRIIYDNINTQGSFKESMPLYIFKDELKKKFNISEERLNEKIIELNKREIIHLRGAEKSEKIEEPEHCIKSKNGKLFYYITWMKR
jgi:hypothetical protein